MSNKGVLDYVDNVLLKLDDVPASQKIQIENELIRHFMKNVENTSIEEVKDNLSSPEKLAAEISKKLFDNNLAFTQNEYNQPGQNHGSKPHPNTTPMYVGEFMQELNNLNIKLLYIPLIQISSRTSRLIMPLFNDDND
jgi:hypothetical protein